MCDLLDYYDRIFLNQIATEQHRLLQEVLQAPSCTKPQMKVKCMSVQAVCGEEGRGNGDPGFCEVPVSSRDAVPNVSGGWRQERLG